MSEAEITYQISEILNRVWAMQQWWASISVGVLIMAHLAANKLNFFLLIISLSLYTAYTIYMYQMMGVNYGTIVDLLADLEVLVNSGSVVSNTAVGLLKVPQASAVLFFITYVGTYVGVMSYLIYSYVKARANVHA